MPNAKVLINTQLGTVELEGEDSFVRTYLDILIPIIEQAQLGSGSAVQATGDPSTDEAGLAKPRIRQRGPQTPGANPAGTESGNCETKVFLPNNAASATSSED